MDGDIGKFKSALVCAGSTEKKRHILVGFCFFHIFGNVLHLRTIFNTFLIVAAFSKSGILFELIKRPAAVIENIF